MVNNCFLRGKEGSKRATVEFHGFLKNVPLKIKQLIKSKNQKFVTIKCFLKGVLRITTLLNITYNNNNNNNKPDCNYGH